MKLIKVSLVTSLLISIALGAEKNSDIDVNANMAIASNYIWRGMTQSDDSPAIQGGIDLGYKNFYAGVWGSNVEYGNSSEASMELDIYAGYADKFYGLDYDIGAISYIYPNESKELNFAEIYFGLSKNFETFEIGAKYYRGIETNDFDPTDAWEADVSVPLPMSITFSALYGDYDNVGNYYSFGITKAMDKFEIGLVYTGIEADADSSDEDNVVAVISASF
jgi:uncharacterized protein (TIGR02001 family)